MRLALSAGQAADMIHPAGGRDHVPTTRQKRNQISVQPPLYRQRNLIERCFNRLKHFRRLATRFNKLARNYLSTVALAAIRL